MELNLDKNPYALAYYTKLTGDYDCGNIRPPEVILPSVPDIPSDCTILPLAQQYLLPSIILWDPLQQLSCFKDGIRCPFECHGSEVVMLEPRKSKKGEYWWQAGQRISLTPRQLCSSNWPVVLLSRLYFCQGRIKHRSYIAHDPEILMKIPPSEADIVPFVLLHRTGFTKELSETVMSLVSSGETLDEVEHIVTQQHISNFAQCKAKFDEDSKLCIANAQSNTEEAPSFPDYKPMGVPSMEMILGSLLINYQEKEVYYTQRMSELSAQILLMGYFFKASQQMGTVGPNRRKWIPKYDYVFAVMNEKGQLLAWQATRGTCHQDVVPLVQKVFQRLKDQGVTIELILTPTCCAFREWLGSIVGPNIQVKMDPCFAYRKLEKRFKVRKCDQELMQTCLQNFSLVFRQPNDIETQRSEETPSPDVMMGNLESFISHWKAVRGESHERLLHEPALRELEALKQDVSNGCLSGIAAGSGGEHVTALRGNLKAVLYRRFLNADLAIPAMTSLFYIWNELHCGAEGAVMPISSYKDALDVVGFVPTTEHFGPTAAEHVEKPEEPKNVDSTFLYTFDVHSIQCLMAAALGAIGQEDVAALPEADINKLSESLLRKVSFQARNYLLIQQNLNSLCPNQSFVNNPRLLHLSTCSVLLFSRLDCEVKDKASHEHRLQENVSHFSGCIFGENGDPDGFFIALANSLNSVLQSLEQENPSEFEQLKETLTSLGYDPEKLDDEQVNVTTLRKIISNEWLESKDKYARLLVSPLLDFCQEAQNFACEGYCKADMLNLLPIAAARVFRLPIILFTSMEHFPVIPVAPVETLSTSKCIYMGYSAACYGTYYTVKLTPRREQSKPKHVCRCGLGNSKDKKERQFCVHIPGRYLTRCECYRNGVACGHLCRCFNCANPQGTSTESRAQYSVQKTRSRPRHKLQRIRSAPLKTADAAKESGTFASDWSNIENLMFECLVDAIHHPYQGLWVLEATPENVSAEYQNLVCIDGHTDIVKERTFDDVKNMLNEFFKNVEVYGSLYKKQTELNWTQLMTVPVTADLTDPVCNQVLVIVESSE